MAHVHSWRRLKKNTFICSDPLCYVKVDLSVLHGKLIKCIGCGAQFILDTSLVASTIPTLNCGKCFPGFPMLTLEEQEKKLTEILKATYEDFILVKTKEFEKTQKELDNFRVSLEAQNAKLSIREKAILSREETLASKARILSEKIRLQRKKYKEEYNKTLISYRESERIANSMKTKQDKAKQSAPIATELGEVQQKDIEDLLFNFINKSLEGKDERA
jgi:hypothetical protein